MNRIHGIALLAAPLLSLAAAPAGAQERWLALGDVGGHRTAIDTAAIRRSSPDRATVRLRLYDAIGRGIDEIQTLEVDCRAERSRLLATREVATAAAVVGRGPQRSTTVADTAWKRFGPGSLGREQVRAVCRFLGGGDARSP